MYIKTILCLPSCVGYVSLILPEGLEQPIPSVSFEVHVYSLSKPVIKRTHATSGYMGLSDYYILSAKQHFFVFS